MKKSNKLSRAGQNESPVSAANARRLHACIWQIQRHRVRTAGPDPLHIYVALSLLCTKLNERLASKTSRRRSRVERKKRDITRAYGAFLPSAWQTVALNRLWATTIIIIIGLWALLFFFLSWTAFSYRFFCCVSSMAARSADSSLCFCAALTANDHSMQKWPVRMADMIGSDRFNSHKWSRVSDEAASDGCLLSTAHVSMSIQGKCERVFFLLDENGEFLAVFFHEDRWLRWYGQAYIGKHFWPADWVEKWLPSGIIAIFGVLSISGRFRFYLTLQAFTCWCCCSNLSIRQAKKFELRYRPFLRLLCMFLIGNNTIEVHWIWLLIQDSRRQTKLLLIPVILLSRE